MAVLDELPMVIPMEVPMVDEGKIPLPKLVVDKLPMVVDSPNLVEQAVEILPRLGRSQIVLYLLCYSYS